MKNKLILKGGNYKKKMEYNMMYMYPTKIKFKKNNWDLWLENLDKTTIIFIYKLRDSYKLFRKLKLKVIEVVETPTDNGMWIMQYPYDYTKAEYPELYAPNPKPHIIIHYKLDFDFHLRLQYKKLCIESYALNINEDMKKKLADFLEANFTDHYFGDEYNIFFSANKLKE